MISFEISWNRNGRESTETGKTICLGPAWENAGISGGSSDDNSRAPEVATKLSAKNEIRSRQPVADARDMTARRHRTTQELWWHRPNRALPERLALPALAAAGAVAPRTGYPGENRRVSHRPLEVTPSHKGRFAGIFRIVIGTLLKP